MQEFVVLHFGRFIDYQNSFDNFLTNITNINLNWHQSATLWRIGKSFDRYPQEGSGNDHTKVRVNLPNRCGDINYFNLKSATLWSSPKVLAGSLLGP